MKLVAVITGGGTGMGRAQAIALSKAGYDVVIAGRRANKLEAVQKEIGETKCQIFPNADIGKKETWERIVAKLKELNGGELHFLGNTAGWVGTHDFMGSCKYEEMDPDSITEYNTAYISGIQLSYHFLAPLLAKGAESTGKSAIVLNVSSVASVVGRGAMSMMPQYGPCKAAIDAITRTAAGLYKDKNILTYGLNQLIFDSELSSLAWEERAGTPFDQAVQGLHPFPVLGNVADVGALTAALCANMFLESGVCYAMIPIDPAMVHSESKSKSMLYTAMIHLDNMDSLNSLPEILFDSYTKIGKAWTEDGKEIPEEAMSDFCTKMKGRLLALKEQAAAASAQA